MEEELNKGVVLESIPEKQPEAPVPNLDAFKVTPPGNYFLIYKTFDDFAKAWTPYIIKRARSYGFSTREDIEDICQDILMDFWEKGYNKIFDPTKSAWNTFFTSFIHYRLLNRTTKRSKDPLNNSLSFENHSTSDESTPSVVDLDKFFTKDDILFDRVEFDYSVDAIREEITSVYPNRRGYVPDNFICKNCGHKVINSQIEKICPSCQGRKWKAIPPPVEDTKKIERSHLVVFDLILKNVSRKQIAQILKFSEASISILVREISELPKMMEFWDIMHGIENN